MVRAVLAGRSTGSGFDLACSSERLCIYGFHGAIIFVSFFALPFGELSLVGLALDLQVD